jgi:hypothetical protein
VRVYPPVVLGRTGPKPGTVSLHHSVHRQTFPIDYR